jgi:uncharacterized membrane protein
VNRGRIRSTNAFRFLESHERLAAPFGTGRFGELAEAFARFFGTPVFLISQSAIVIGWIVANATGLVHLDLYPFILLNLAFSLQAAYAAPLILLAQTREADRDKAYAKADAHHREELARESAEREDLAVRQVQLLLALLEQNTRLTERIDQLTSEIHSNVVRDGTSPPSRHDPSALD